MCDGELFFKVWINGYSGMQPEGCSHNIFANCRGKKKKHLCLPFDPFDEVFILHITALGMPVKVSCS